jgi:hypothetical protein
VEWRSAGVERGAEAFQRFLRVAGGPSFEADDALVAEPAEGGGDGGVVDFSGAGFLSSGHVGDLDLADEGQGAFDEVDEVSSPIWAW